MERNGKLGTQTGNYGQNQAICDENSHLYIKTTNYEEKGGKTIKTAKIAWLNKNKQFYD